MNGVTVFAGQDTDATAKARSYFPEVPPSSPSMALLKDGKLVDFVPRHQIEGRPPAVIALALFHAEETRAQAVDAGADALISKEAFVTGLAEVLPRLFPARAA